MAKQPQSGRKGREHRAGYGSHKNSDLGIGYDAQMRMVEQAGASEGWSHPESSIEPSGPDVTLQLIMAMGDKLSRMLDFIAAGRAGGTMDMRAWVVVYVIRPDLVKHESTRRYAAARGVKDSRVRTLVQEFRALFPKGAFLPSSRSSQPSTPPPGKASL